MIMQGFALLQWVSFSPDMSKGEPQNVLVDGHAYIAAMVCSHYGVVHK
jgi:hypothetical protein